MCHVLSVYDIEPQIKLQFNNNGSKEIHILFSKYVYKTRIFKKAMLPGSETKY